jgi:SAM-dependent methyltransferase
MSRYEAPLRKIARLPMRLLRDVSARGPRDTLGWCWYQFAWRWREWRLGINTREFAHGIVVPDQGACHGYEPIDHRCFDIILADLDIQAGKDVFLDYGCGMGRAVVLAAREPFRRVLGIEIDAILSEIARQHIAAARQRGKLRCPEAQIITTDAAAWQVPEDVTVVFLFNSFTGELLEAVLERIRESVQAAPRPLKLVYVYPTVAGDLLADTPWLVRQRELPTGYWTHIRSVVYAAKAEVDDAHDAEAALEPNDLPTSEPSSLSRHS